MKLYQHQRDAVNEMMYAVEVDGCKNIVLFGPTSFGKSLVLSTLAKELDGKIIILVNITALIDQIAEHLDEIGQDYSILKAGYEDKFDADKKIQLVMSQTFYARSDNIDFGDIEIICQDEAHREWLTARTKHMIDTLNPVARIGVSGTPFDESGYALENVDATVTTKTVKELEDEGYVVPVKYFIPKWSENIDYTNLRSSGSDYSGTAIDEAINTNEHAELIVKSMNKMNAKNKKTIVFANSIEHADSIANALKNDGYVAYSYHSKNDKSSAERAMSEFKTGIPIQDGLIGGHELPVKCLIAVSKISVGFSVKDIELMVLCRPTKVLSLFQQMVGRGIRTFPGKQHVECLDLAQCLATHGFHNDPYYPPEKGDKKSLLQKKEERSLEVIKTMVTDEPIEINKDAVEVALEELRSKEKKIPQLTMEEIMYVFEATSDVRVIITVFHEMNLRLRRLTYNERNILWATNLWEEFISKFPGYRSRIIRTMKTRAKNIVKDRKKPGALGYFPGWLITQDPYALQIMINETAEEDEEYDLPPVIDIDEDDIPF